MALREPIGIPRYLAFLLTYMCRLIIGHMFLPPALKQTPTEFKTSPMNVFKQPKWMQVAYFASPSKENKSIFLAALLDDVALMRSVLVNE